MFSEEAHPHVRSGYLHKQARKSHRNWKKRWIVINLKLRIVSYYKTKKDFDRHKKPAGTFSLPSANETFVGPCSSNKANSFEIYHIDKGTGQKTSLLSLAADSVAWMDQWVEMLEEICHGNRIGDDEGLGTDGMDLDDSPDGPGQRGSRHESRPSTAKARIHARQARQSIVAQHGSSKRRSVAPSHLTNVPNQANTAQSVGQVEVIGAGTHQADGHYRTTRIGADPTVLAAYMSNTGYRLNLVKGVTSKSNQWQLLHPSQDLLLYSVRGNVLVGWEWCTCVGWSWLPCLILFVSFVVFLWLLLFRPVLQR